MHAHTHIYTRTHTHILDMRQAAAIMYRQESLMEEMRFEFGVETKEGG